MFLYSSPTRLIGKKNIFLKNDSAINWNNVHNENGNGEINGINMLINFCFFIVLDFLKVLCNIILQFALSPLVGLVFVTKRL